MPFQGPGTGISGTSNQFAVGYAQSAGNATYANQATYAATTSSLHQGSSLFPVYVTGTGNIYSLLPNNSIGLSQMFNNGVNYILTGQAAAFSPYLSGYFAYSVYTGGRWYIASDKRIKKRITNEEKPQYLETVNKLGVERFTYIDTLKNGDSTVTGFFAQDVESVIPTAVQKTPDYIPSVMKKATKVEGTTITCENHGFNQSDHVKFHIDKGEGAMGIYGTVTNVIDDDTFEVDNDEVSEPLFVYGKLAEDFMTVDENKILPHTVGAIQELHLLIKGLEKRIENLESLVVK